MNDIKIFLDDVRNAPEGYILVRTVEDAINLLCEYTGHIDELSLDVDLDDFNIGYRVLNWIENKFYTNDNYILPNNINVHSINESVRLKMEHAINKLYSDNYQRSLKIAEENNF